MQTLLIKLKEGCARHLVVVVLVVLALVEILSLAVLAQPPAQPPAQPELIFSGGAAQESDVSQSTLKISEIRGSRIDDEAAMVVVRESAPVTDEGVPVCSTLPASIWIFLVAAYVALLLFNFSSTFERAIRPQWFFEGVLTILALISWYSLDGCQTALWFPFAIVKFGLITFALYAYLVEKKLVVGKTGETAEKTASMF